jgi:hypothetical protein
MMISASYFHNKDISNGFLVKFLDSKQKVIGFVIFYLFIWGSIFSMIGSSLGIPRIAINVIDGIIAGYVIISATYFIGNIINEQS